VSIAYRVALLIHIAAVLAAISASTMLHYAHRQTRAAGTPQGALRWHRLSARTSVVYPIVLVALLATGGYMVSSTWTWRTGWVNAGLLGLAFLFVNGVRLGKAGRALAGDLVKAASSGTGVEPFAAAMRRADVAGWANTGVALGVVVAMTTKPGLIGALALVALGGLVAAYVGPRPVLASAHAEQVVGGEAA